MRNPDWVRDEIILAMDLYVRLGRKQLPATHNDVIALSELLNALPIHQRSGRDENFRNANGISMILGNFLGVDPMHAQPGLSRNNQLQERVWNEFIDDVALLRRTADAITRCAVLDLSPVAEDESIAEGGLLLRWHTLRERNKTLVKKKKDQVLAKSGRLACDIFEFDFLECYGELGRGFAECHHKIALAEAVFDTTTRLSDLAIVCANCHRMLHRANPLMAIDELQRHLSNRHEQGLQG
jgi:5-methylcytosine-specific restriction enzyme A